MFRESRVMQATLSHYGLDTLRYKTAARANQSATASNSLSDGQRPHAHLRINMLPRKIRRIGGHRPGAFANGIVSAIASKFLRENAPSSCSLEFFIPSGSMPATRNKLRSKMCIFLELAVILTPSIRKQATGPSSLSTPFEIGSSPVAPVPHSRLCCC
jgi:hypothetical protein